MKPLPPIGVPYDPEKYQPSINHFYEKTIKRFLGFELTYYKINPNYYVLKFPPYLFYRGVNVYGSVFRARLNHLVWDKGDFWSSFKRWAKAEWIRYKQIKNPPPRESFNYEKNTEDYKAATRKRQKERREKNKWDVIVDGKLVQEKSDNPFINIQIPQ